MKQLYCLNVVGLFSTMVKYMDISFHRDDYWEQLIGHCNVIDKCSTLISVQHGHNGYNRMNVIISI